MTKKVRDNGPTEKAPEEQLLEEGLAGGAAGTSNTTKWNDTFFAGRDSAGRARGGGGEIVAVFDHDYTGMIRYAIKVMLLTKIIPLTSILVSTTVVVTIPNLYVEEECQVGYDPYLEQEFRNCYPKLGQENLVRNLKITRWTLVVSQLLWFLLTLYGSYRIGRSSIVAYHLAVTRKGIEAVQDEHLYSGFGFFGYVAAAAALHIFDKYLTVQPRTELLQFEDIDDVVVKEPGQIKRQHNHLSFMCLLKCTWLCQPCLKIPYYTVEVETPSREGENGKSSYSLNEAMDGLEKPDEFKSLCMQMKGQNR